jgi:CheY-like chemotaxis protein
MDKLLRRLIGEDIDLVTTLDPQVPHIKVDPGQLEQVIVNLSVNARDAMPEGGKLTIETKGVVLDAEYAQHHAEVMPGPYVMIAVTDTGTGMDNQTLHRLFEPFFTTKAVGKGTGLGLSVVHGIVKQSGGHIWVYSEPGKGTTFKVYFPAVEEALSVTTAEFRLPGEALRGSETILLVEDEQVVRDLASMVLEGYGYNLLAASDPDEAVLLATRFKGKIHLLLTDVVLPQCSGRVLRERLATTRPDMKVIYMSGYTENAVVHRGVVDAGTAFVQKPFSTAALAKKVRDVLDGMIS